MEWLAGWVVAWEVSENGSMHRRRVAGDDQGDLTPLQLPFPLEEGSPHLLVETLAYRAHQRPISPFKAPLAPSTGFPLGLAVGAGPEAGLAVSCLAGAPLPKAT